MSASSGIPVSPSLVTAFADALQSSSVRFLKVAIHNENLVHQLSIDTVGSFVDDLAMLQDDHVLSETLPAFIFARLDPPSTGWTVISYVPNHAKVRDKMLYASSRASLFKSLGSALFTGSIYATSKADLTPEAYQAHLQHLASPKPLSTRELAMADVRAEETSSASYLGSRSRATHVGTSIGFKWTPEIEEAITELGRGDDCAIIVFTVDPETETILLKLTSKISINQLASSIPNSEPCYALLAWPQSHTLPPRREIVFIYSCPSSSPIRHRMLYSAGSGTTQRQIQEWFASTAPMTHFSPRKIETSDPRELTEDYVIEELGLQSSNPEEFGDNSGGPSGTHGVLKLFARPRGPPRRR